VAALTREPAITQDQGMREGIQLSEAITGDGVAVFGHACWMDLEGIVSKALSRSAAARATSADVIGPH